MKKILFSLVLSTGLFASTATYAADKEPSAHVKQALSKEFAQAKEVKWSTISEEGIYEAKFLYNDEPLQAFFTTEGEFLGTTRQISRTQLPILIAASLEKQYADARVITVFEYSKTDGLAYYITLVNSKRSMIVKALGNGELSVYKKNVQ